MYQFSVFPVYIINLIISFVDFPTAEYPFNKFSNFSHALKYLHNYVSFDFIFTETNKKENYKKSRDY